MNVVKDDTAVELSSALCLVQNVGPGNLYIGLEGVTSEDGIQLLPGESISLGASTSKFFCFAGDDDCDVRILSNALGIFPISTQPV